MGTKLATTLRRNVGRRVAEVRAERGATQEQLAEKLAVSVKYLQMIEAGAENLTLDSLARLATVLSVPVASLFTRATTRPRPGRPRKPSPKR